MLYLAGLKYLVYSVTVKAATPITDSWNRDTAESHGKRQNKLHRNHGDCHSNQIYTVVFFLLRF